MISTLYSGAQIVIGDGVKMSGTVVAAAESVVISDHVMCGGNVTIMDTDWHGLLPSDRGKRGASAPVFIEENVWLGLNVTVTKGVRVGRDSVVGAGSVVTREIPAGVVAAGQPARVIRRLI
jgi:acetyltransferase-like isoleucine patch superfamily enzyme